MDLRVLSLERPLPVNACGCGALAALRRTQRTFALEFKRGRRQSLTVLQKTSKQNKNNSNGQNLQVLVTNVKNNVKTINF